MKVFVGTDLEGVAGVVSFEKQCYADGKYYEAARRLQTAEINAAVDGMIQMAVEDILISDGHGPGAVLFEELHPAAKLLHGRPAAPRPVRDEVIGTYDACMMLGQHAMAGTPDGNLNHTQSSRAVDSYRLNGRGIGEIAQFALYHGALGLQMIFLSGDEAACREARELIPSVTTVSVKKGLGRSCAVSLSAQKARELIRAGVIEAIRKQQKDPIAPLVWDGPYVLEKRFFHTDVAAAAASAPDAERVDSQIVRFRSDDIREIIYR